MADEGRYGDGAGVAAISVCQMILSALLAKGVIEPNFVREVLDGISLRFEQDQNSPAPEIRRVARDARDQLQLLARALEVTSPQMVLSKAVQDLQEQGKLQGGS